MLNAGRHSRYTMNTLMRNPDWNKGKRDCTISIHPEDARELGLEDGDLARITTEGGTAACEIQVTPGTARGMVLIPHGFGLMYTDSERGERTHGINVNALTSGANRDPLGTPLHRFVPCRLEKEI